MVVEVCSTAGEHMPYIPEVIGLNPSRAGIFSFLLPYFSLQHVPHGTLLIFQKVDAGHLMHLVLGKK